jgi:hypothetical protein
MDPTLLVAELNKVAATLPQDVKTRQTLYEAARHLMLKTENLHELTHRILFSVGQPVPEIVWNPS